jgi:hypothetical protein
MKIPEQWKAKLEAESTHKVMSLNTMSLIGISFLWAHFLGLISLWFLPVTILSLLASYGSEIAKRQL